MTKKEARYLQSKLITAIQREDAKDVRKWLDRGASPNSLSRSKIARVFTGSEASPLREAFRVKSVPIMEVLLEVGADPQEENLLGSACWDGPVEIVELLISFGARVGPVDLQYAVQQNQILIAEFLLEQGVENSLASEFLNGTWYKCHPIMLRLFEKYGFDYTDEMKAAMASHPNDDRGYGE